MRAARLHRLLLLVIVVVVDERKERWCGAKAKALQLHLPVLWTRRQVSSSNATCKDDDDDDDANIMVTDD